MAELIRVAALADIPASGLHRVRAGEEWVCLYRVDSEVLATADQCTHAVASLADGTLKGHTVECPRHGARFDVRTGRNLCLPAVRPVKSYAVVVQDGEVYLSL